MTDTRSILRFALFPTRIRRGRWIMWKYYVAYQRLKTIHYEGERGLFSHEPGSAQAWITYKRKLL